MHRLFPPDGENALAPLRHLRAKRRRFAAVALRNARLRAGVLSPPDPLRWAPAGAPGVFGRRTVLKISPPKNPRKFTGVAIRAAGQLSAARGRGTVSALIPADADPALAPDFAALDTCAASWQYLLLRWGSRTLTADAHPGRRGPGGESAGIIAQAAPSGAEGAESGAEARRHPCAGKRTLHFAVRPWGT